MCYNVVTLDMFLIFNFRPIIIYYWNTFLNMEIGENEENNTTNQEMSAKRLERVNALSWSDPLESDPDKVLSRKTGRNLSANEAKASDFR